MKNKGFEPPRTISETIFQYIKKSIIEGKMKSAQRLQEKEIAELFGVSTTPVREAFQRLAAEKYLILSARREVVIAGVSSKEIVELFEVIRVLDTHATKKALKAMSDKDIKELKKMSQQLDAFYKQNKIQSYVNKNYKIHEKLWNICGNKFLYQSLINLMEKTITYSNQVSYYFSENPTFFKKSHKDHVDLIKAIEKRDEAAVEKILSSHWGKGFIADKIEDTAS
ncbi:MAG: GntR family transcriptional regulator [Candidatus Aminicenantes bacterium]|nr:MAG: GntR family transcriptional regulator [Candidatus Aminicenantes bacterium]